MTLTINDEVPDFTAEPSEGEISELWPEGWEAPEPCIRIVEQPAS